MAANLFDLTGETAVVIGATGVQIKLNAHGCESLSLANAVDFLVAPDLKGWSEAVSIFKRMQDLECGRVLRAA